MRTSIPRSRSGCVSLVSEPRFRSPAYFVSNLIIVMSPVRIMLPRRDPRSLVEPSFPDIAQLGEAIANVIQTAIRPPQITHLETVYNLKLPTFVGNESHEGSERWLEHVEKTFQVIQSQGNLLAERWVETTSWFLGRELASWWNQETYGWSPEEKASWENFRRSFYKTFIPPANEYYKKFTDLSRYDEEIAANPAKMAALSWELRRSGAIWRLSYHVPHIRSSMMFC